MRSLLGLACLLLIGCAQEPNGSAISDVRWSLRTNDPDTVLVHLNMESDLPTDSGFVVPNAQQSEGGALHVRFTLKDPEGTDGRFRYMVYYRNETYKLPETREDLPIEENFYGFWEDGYHLSDPVPAEGLVVQERITVRSDPRHEFPGSPWVRNPRTGRYSLLIVAIPERAFIEHPPPPEVLDGHMRMNGHFAEPYAYWLHGDGHLHEAASVVLVPNALALSVQLYPDRGVQGCSGAHPDFEPFIHHLDPDAHFPNVPVVADVLANTYGPSAYDSTICFTPQRNWIDTRITVPADPCANLRVDSARHCLVMSNPASSPGDYRKENTGVRSRAAFTYGRFLVHAQLSPLLNDSDLWNGLTNAVWLIGTGASGALRRPCSSGYLSYASDGGQERRIDRTNYAEIDFEIMKGMPLCPERSFPPIYPQHVITDPNVRGSWNRALPAEVRAQRGKVTVACTNWDLACADPPRFGIGCQDIVLDDRVFTAHRWDRDYRAVTEKSMEPDDALFGPEGCWFEIDWRPTEIFWRIGPTPDELRTVGYMNSSMTSIPDVPMWLVVTQEFHNTLWWPGSPYEQGGIPFPGKPIEGRVFDAWVE